MTRAAHTPGPWFAQGGWILPEQPPHTTKAVGDLIRQSGHMNAVAQVYAPERWQNGNAQQHHEANAHLIAAAPDLLDVLSELFGDGPVRVALAGNPIACDALEAKARAAIFKATGGK